MASFCDVIGVILVSGLAQTGIDSKYLSYGLVDNREPMAKQAASLCVAELVTFDVALLSDLTDYGKRAGYGNRRGRWTEVDPGVSFAHTVAKDDATWVPTPLDMSLGWTGEYHPCPMGHRRGDWGEATQFVNMSIGMPELFLEPTLALEKDVVRDDGAYLNAEIGHELPLGDGNFTLRPSVSQGWGDRRRVGAYLADPRESPIRHAGLMDTFMKMSLRWKFTENVSVMVFGGASDYAFDRRLRHAARRYEASGHYTRSGVLVVGTSLCLEF